MKLKIEGKMPFKELKVAFKGIDDFCYRELSEEVKVTVCEIAWWAKLKLIFLFIINRIKHLYE